MSLKTCRLLSHKSLLISPWQVKSRKIPDPNKPGSKMEDYWGPAQQMLADNNFLASLKTYDKDNMPEALMVKIRPYIADPNFDPAVVRKASKAAYGLCCWIRAMESYDKVNKVSSKQMAYIQLIYGFRCGVVSVHQFAPLS